MAELEWIDWDKVERCVKRLPPDACYLALRERQGNNEAQVGRVAIHIAQLRRYMAPEPERHEEEDDDEEGLEDDELELEQDELESAGDDEPDLQNAIKTETPAEAIPTRDQLLEAACRWTRAHAEANLNFDETTRYRLRAYGPKGKQPLVSACFAVKNLAWDPDAAPSRTPKDATPPTAIVQGPIRELPRVETKEGVFAPYRALGQYYEQFGQVLANGYGQLQNLNTAMITGLYDQLRQSHHHRDTLVTSVVRLRTEQIEKAETRERLDQSESERNALARQALEQLGQATKAVFVSQGISPEHMEVLDSLTASPELMETLRDPRVRLLIRDPNNLRALAGLLGQIAIQQHQQAAMAQQGMMPGYAQPGMMPGYSQPGMMPGYAQAGMVPGHAPQGILPGYSPQGKVPGHAAQGAMPGYAPQGMMAGHGPHGMPPGHVPPGIAPGQGPVQGEQEPPAGGSPGQQAA